MKTLTCVLGLALAMSALANAVMVGRLARRTPDVASRTAAPAVEPPAPMELPPNADRLDHVLVELSRLRCDVAELRSRAPAAPVERRSDAAESDVELARILAEQDRWNAMLGDLGKISSARRQQLIAEDRYERGVLDTTADYLGMQEPQRGVFLETARGVMRDVERARRDLDAALRGDPRPTREQSQAALAAYRMQQSAAQERLVAVLDPNQAVQRQFASQVGSWLRTVGAAPEWRGFDRP